MPDAPPSGQGPASASRSGGPKRVYERADYAHGEGGFVLTLDGRPARTPGRTALILPTCALAQAVAAEWQGQGGHIDPRKMPLTKLANSAIDGVARDLDAVRADILRYARSDLLFYRAGEPARLIASQAGAWDPILDWAHETFGARFFLSEGIVFVTQPEASVARLSEVVAGERSPFGLAALHVMTSLTGSVLIALAQALGHLSAEDAWAAAHVDERFQESLWGEDADAAARRAAREVDFQGACRTYALSRES